MALLNCDDFDPDPQSKGRTPCQRTEGCERAPMLALFETSAGIALFKITNEAKLQAIIDDSTTVHGPEELQSCIQLKQFSLFRDMTVREPQARCFFSLAPPLHASAAIRRTAVTPGRHTGMRWAHADAHIEPEWRCWPVNSLVSFVAVLVHWHLHHVH